MGYYSFYKILKDMLKVLFGKNILKLIIFSLLLGIILFFLNKNYVAAAFGDYDISKITDNDFIDSIPSWVTSDPNMHYFLAYSQNPTTGYYNFDFFAFTGDVSFNNNFSKYYGKTGTTKFYCMYGAFSTYNSSKQEIINSISSAVKDNNISRLSNSLHFGYGDITNAYYFTDVNIYDTSFTNVILEATNINYPEILTSVQDLSTLFFDVLRINAKDYSQQDLYLLCYDKNYESIDSLKNLYPVNEILLNQQSKYFVPGRTQNIENGAIYWINKDEIGFDWSIGNSYSFRFAVRVPVESDFSSWEYEYLTEDFNFTIDSNVLQSQIDDLNKQTKEYEEKQRHEETIGAIDRQTEQDNNFYNGIMSDSYDEDKPSDTLGGVTSSTDSIDDTEYTGLFSAIFTRFSNIVNGDFNTVEEIKYPIPNTDGEIVITSDLLSSKIQGTFIYGFLQASWYFIFGMYIFKFSNNLIRKIKDGSILNGYENNNEVITSTML